MRYCNLIQKPEIVHHHQTEGGQNSSPAPSFCPPRLILRKFSSDFFVNGEPTGTIVVYYLYYE